jgi:hypothetical protein
MFKHYLKYAAAAGNVRPDMGPAGFVPDVQAMSNLSPTVTAIFEMLGDPKYALVVYALMELAATKGFDPKQVVKFVDAVRESMVGVNPRMSGLLASFVLISVLTQLADPRYTTTVYQLASSRAERLAAGFRSLYGRAVTGVLTLAQSGIITKEQAMAALQSPFPGDIISRLTAMGVDPYTAVLAVSSGNPAVLGDPEYAKLALVALHNGQKAEVAWVMTMFAPGMGVNAAQMEAFVRLGMEDPSITGDPRKVAEAMGISPIEANRLIFASNQILNILRTSAERSNRKFPYGSFQELVEVMGYDADQVLGYLKRVEDIAPNLLQQAAFEAGQQKGALNRAIEEFKRSGSILRAIGAYLGLIPVDDFVGRTREILRRLGVPEAVLDFLDPKPPAPMQIRDRQGQPLHIPPPRRIDVGPGRRIVQRPDERPEILDNRPFIGPPVPELAVADLAVPGINPEMARMEDESQRILASLVGQENVPEFNEYGNNLAEYI